MDAPKPTEHLRASPALRWWVLVPALVMPLIGSFFYFVLFPGTTFGNTFYAADKTLMLIWPVLATWLILKEPFRRESPGVVGRRRSLLIGGLFGVAVAALMLILKETPWFGAVLEQNGGRIRERVDGLGMLDHFLIAAIAISVVHAALEEYYWRWFVYGHLRHLVSQPWAHGIAAVGFLAHHIVVTSQFFPLGFAVFLGICVGIGGAVWSVIYQRHRTLLGAWFSHMIVDFAIFYLGYRILFS